MSYRLNIAPLLLLTCCQPTGLKVNGHSLQRSVEKYKDQVANPTVTITNLAGALNPERIFFQTRSVLSLDISSDQINTGDSLQLFNDSTNTSLVKTDAINLGLQGNDEGAALTSSSAFDLVLTIYPMDPSFTSKFSYGANKLRLMVDEKQKELQAASQVTLQDFTFFTVGTANFEQSGGQGDQIQQGFQGRVSTLGGPLISNSQDEITVGTIGMSNR